MGKKSGTTSADVRETGNETEGADIHALNDTVGAWVQIRDESSSRKNSVAAWSFEKRRVVRNRSDGVYWQHDDLGSCAELGKKVRKLEWRLVRHSCADRQQKYLRVHHRREDRWFCWCCRRECAYGAFPWTRSGDKNGDESPRAYGSCEGERGTGKLHQRGGSSNIQQRDEFARGMLMVDEMDMMFMLSTRMEEWSVSRSMRKIVTIREWRPRRAMTRRAW